MYFSLLPHIKFASQFSILIEVVFSFLLVKFHFYNSIFEFILQKTATARVVSALGPLFLVFVEVSIIFLIFCYYYYYYYYFFDVTMFSSSYSISLGAVNDQHCYPLLARDGGWLASNRKCLLKDPHLTLGSVLNSLFVSFSKTLSPSLPTSFLLSFVC